MRSPDPWIHGRPEEPWLHGRPEDGSALPDPYETLARAYESVQQERDEELPITHGAIPEGLAGTLYRNGPGRVSIGGERYGHVFDGDGMIVRFAIGGGRVHYRNRYVRTREHLAEQRAGRVLFRGFGTQIPGGARANLFRTHLKNAANTSVRWHAGVLRALWEGGAPHRIDPVTLETIGLDDLGGLLRPEGALERAIAGSWPFCAHPAIDPRTGTMWGFGTIPGRTPRLAIYGLDAEGAPLERRIVRLARPAFVHDFVLTERHAVFVVSPVVFDVARAVLGVTTPAGSLRRDPSAGTLVVVVPRDGGPVRTIESRAGFAFHHIAGWDAGPREIVLDTLRMEGLDAGGLDVLDPESMRRRPFERAVPTRLVIDLARGRVIEEPLLDADVELPSIDPRRCTREVRVAFGIARPSGWKAITHPGLARMDLAARTATVRDFAPDLPGEPIFVPSAGGAEGEGWVLSLVYRAREHRSELLVLDAQDLSTVAIARLPHHVPPGFHGTFVEG